MLIYLKFCVEKRGWKTLRSEIQRINLFDYIITATPTNPIYGPISDSPEQHLLYGIVSVLIPLEPLRSQTEFE
jgi:hypothetical protein